MRPSPNNPAIQVDSEAGEIVEPSGRTLRVHQENAAVRHKSRSHAGALERGFSGL
jgi:hypothetical protein